MNLSDIIASIAQALGIPTSLALAQAKAESGGKQYNSDGSLVTSSAGAIGVMQLMPGTAAQLGVDPTDATQNVQGGLSYLSQLFNQFGNWFDALAAYNWGPGNVQRAQAAGTAYPTSVQAYANGILNNAGIPADSSSSNYVDYSGSSGYSDVSGTSYDASSTINPLTVAAVVAAAGVALLLLFD